MSKVTFLCRKCGTEVSQKYGNVGQASFGGVLCSRCFGRGWKLVNGELVDAAAMIDPPKSEAGFEIADDVRQQQGAKTHPDPMMGSGAAAPSPAAIAVQEAAAEKAVQPVKMAVPEPVAPRDPELEERQREHRELYEWRQAHVYEVPPDLGRMAQMVVVEALDAIGTDDRKKWQEAGRRLEWLGQTIGFNGGCGYLRLGDPYVPTISLREALFGKPVPARKKRKEAG